MKRGEVRRGRGKLQRAAIPPVSEAIGPPNKLALTQGRKGAICLFLPHPLLLSNTRTHAHTQRHPHVPAVQPQKRAGARYFACGAQPQCGVAEVV